ncbi:DUF4935 domain-containing protein [Rhizobium leguminosarum bv. trifolii]|uniref:PIN-like domain-containing protein n=1 Tax=Rhizobium leguminosarum TaxID=384 RepID=UPI00140FCE5D|nr:PIN-like domain-containing protein [Rhizobium leguminosarum]QIO53467.1 DUF4935 domain-containing protein [Rhizobium leguminosarum bv. trifolii]
MREQFSAFYKPDEAALANMWKSCVFVVDANVLLNLYRYQPKSRDDLLKVLEKVKERLWVPHQAAMEYQRNRLRVINDQRQSFGTVKTQIQESYHELDTRLKKLNLSGRHAQIDLVPFLAQTKKLFDRFESKLDELEQKQPGIHDHDQVRQQLDDLLGGVIGDAPDQGVVDDTAKEGRERYKHLMPPGYKDEAEKKNEFYTFDGVRYPAMFGDLILWRQIIAKAKDADGKPFILITDDQKEDWWLKVGGQTIGPQPELVSEIMREAKIAGFHMYNVARFLAFAPQMLDVQVKKSSIEDAQEISRQNAVKSRDTRWAASISLRFDSRIVESSSAVREVLRNVLPLGSSIVIFGHSGLIRIPEEVSGTEFATIAQAVKNTLPLVQAMLKVRKTGQSYKIVFDSTNDDTPDDEDPSN